MNVRGIPFVLLFAACDTDPAVGRAPDVVEAQQPAKVVAAASAKPDTAPRRVYGPGDFALDKCAKRAGGDIVGAACGGGFTVFGPYVEAPANSDVEFVLEVEPSSDATVVADVVSDVGSVFHAATPPVLVKKGERRWTGVRVHLFSHATKLEARVAVNADGKPVDYKIRGLALNVR